MGLFLVGNIIAPILSYLNSNKNFVKYVSNPFLAFLGVGSASNIQEANVVQSAQPPSPSHSGQPGLSQQTSHQSTSAHPGFFKSEGETSNHHSTQVQGEVDGSKPQNLATGTSQPGL